MRSLFLDTEFTSLSPEYRLISLALVDPEGPEFYVELNEGWEPAECSAFVQRVVLPQLDLDRHGLSAVEAGERLRAFLETYACVEILSDALAWDWPLLLDLLGPRGLPASVGACRETRKLARCVPDGQIPHHALLDARLMCGLYPDAQVS